MTIPICAQCSSFREWLEVREQEWHSCRRGLCTCLEPTRFCQLPAKSLGLSRLALAASAQVLISEWAINVSSSVPELQTYVLQDIPN